jgi:hypothetical protein
VLLQELWACSFSQVFCWSLGRKDFNYRFIFVARLFELCIDGVGHPLWTALRFQSRKGAIDFLLQACRSYADQEMSFHTKVFVSRVKSRLNQPVPESWLVGTAWLFAHSESIVTRIVYSMNTSQIAQNDNCDIAVLDDSYIDLAKQLFQ